VQAFILDIQKGSKLSLRGSVLFFSLKINSVITSFFLQKKEEMISENMQNKGQYLSLLTPALLFLKLKTILLCKKKVFFAVTTIHIYSI